MDIKLLSDDELVSEYKNCNDLACAELIQRHYLLLLGIALRILNDEQEAIDCIREVLSDLLEFPPEKRAVQFLYAIKAFLVALVKNKALKVNSQRRKLAEYMTHLANAAESEENNRDIVEREKEEWVRIESLLLELKGRISKLSESDKVFLNMYISLKETSRHKQQMMQLLQLTDNQYRTIQYRIHRTLTRELIKNKRK